MAHGFLDELRWRGLLHQVTSESLASFLAAPGQLGYAGFDPTSDSLTIGNAIPMLMLARWQRAGHRPLVLMGGGTGLIGDPSGKSVERTLMSEEQVRHNVASQRAIFERAIDFTGAHAGAIVDNSEWLAKLGFIEVLRDVGKHFSVNQMIARDSVAARLNQREQGISYTEFSYMILQAYDFLHLCRTRGCRVQLGGSDQFGNIVSGIDLIRRQEGIEAFGITNPLVTAADGSKIGKSEKGAIFVTADRTSPYRFHQFWLNTSDADVGRYLRWFTFLPRERIEELEAIATQRPEAREGQRVLADELTTLFHGAGETDRARRAAEALFSGRVCDLDQGMVREIAAELPSSEVSEERLAGEGTPLVELLAETTLAKSRREAREYLAAGAVLINGDKASAEHRVRSSDLLHGEVALLRRGKRNWHALRRGGRSG
ncbi:MAG: tyrosine--tRNA ligase [Phycisphaeraceae bacterium]|nr:tyrosine--tRNA ligase [Phycisphaeraceae bacterium]